jgi:hypothetical protein
MTMQRQWPQPAATEDCEPVSDAVNFAEVGARFAVWLHREGQPGTQTGWVIKLLARVLEELKAQYRCPDVRHLTQANLAAAVAPLPRSEHPRAMAVIRLLGWWIAKGGPL